MNSVIRIIEAGLHQGLWRKFILLKVFSWSMLLSTGALYAVTQAEIDTMRHKALAYLFLTQDADGFWDGPSKTDIQATSQALHAFHSAGIDKGVHQRAGLSWLANIHPTSVTALAAQISALGQAGWDFDAQLSQLNKARNNRFNGWGAYQDYQPSFPHTAIAHDSMFVAGAAGSNNVTSYIRNTAQNSDGGWPYMAKTIVGSVSASSELIPTAYAVLSLSHYRTIGQGSDADITEGINWLTAKQLIDGGFSDDTTATTGHAYETALVLQAIRAGQQASNAAANAATSTITAAEDFLATNQSVNGSWNDDLMATSAVIQGLSSVALLDNDNDGIPDDVELLTNTDPLVADAATLIIGIGDSIEGLTLAQLYELDIEVGTEITGSLPYSGTSGIVGFFVSGGLPEGVTVNTVTGALQGTPLVAGEHHINYRVEYSDGSEEERSITLNVDPVPSLNVPAMPVGLLVLLAGVLAIVSKYRQSRAYITVACFCLFVGTVFSPDIQAQVKLPEDTARIITDAFDGHPAKRDETVRSIDEHINAIAIALDEDNSIEARKMFAIAHRTALESLNKRLNAELSGKQQRRYQLENSSAIDLSLAEIEAKDSSMRSFFAEIDALLSLEGTEALDAFLSIRERLDAANDQKLPGHAVPNVRHVADKVGPPKQTHASKSIPAYLSDTYRDRAQTLYAFNGDLMLLAAAPSTPPEATTCNYDPVADLADDGKDVTFTAEIHDKAQALGYSPVKIFEFVANEIEFQPYYGALKGSHATLVTKSGGATDQASLLIALLRASNIPARYVRGEVEAEMDDSLGSEKDSRIAKWLKAESLDSASYRLEINGNPAANYAGNDRVQFSHVWVEACVPYAHYQGTRFDQLGHRWIPLDPSFEVRTYKDGVSTGTTFDFDAYLSGFQKKMPEEYLEQDANAAITEFDKGVKDIGYQSEKQKLQIDILPASLPYNVLKFTDWSNTSSPDTAELPDTHRYFLTLDIKNNGHTQLGASITRLLSEVVLKPVTLYFKGATASHENTMQNWRLNGGTLPNLNVVPVILIDGVEESVGTVTVNSNTLNNRADMRVTMAEFRDDYGNHPACPSVSNTIIISDACFDTVSAANYHSFQAWAYQGTDNVLDDVAEQVINNVNLNALPATDIHNTLGRFLHFMSLGYMRDITHAGERIAKIYDTTGDSGVHLGMTYSRSQVEKVLDIPFGMIKTGFSVDVPAAQSRSVNRDLSGDLINFDEFFAYGNATSAYETHIWQEYARLDAISTVRGIQLARAQGTDVLTINSANQSTELPKLVAVENGNSGTAAYPNGFIYGFLKPNYIDIGFDITIPDRRINYEGWQGLVFIGRLETPTSAAAAFPISGDYTASGGYTVSNPVNFNFDSFLDTGYRGGNIGSISNGNVTGSNTTSFDLNPAIFQSDYGVIGNGGGPINTFGGDPVNLVTGNFYHTETDLVISHRDLPFVFERVYNSREPQLGPLGYGWTHSFNHYLLFVSEDPDGEETSADIDGTTSSLVWFDGSGGEKRIEVSGASSGGVSGASFTNREGQYFSFVRETDGSYTITEKNGLIYRFEVSAGDVDDIAKLTQIESRNGNTLTLSYVGDELDIVTDTTGRFIDFTYTNGKISRVEDWTGRAHEYRYDADDNLEEYLNPLALAGEHDPMVYRYFTDDDSETIDHAIKSITFPKGNGMDFEYYVDGRVFRHTNTTGETFTFQYNDFRRETVVTDARGFSKQYFFNAYGNPVEIIDEEGGISNYEYEDPGDPYLRTAVINEVRLRTEYEYNANGTLVLERKPSGNTIEYSEFNSFEQPGKIKDLNGNYQILKYDGDGNVTDTIAFKAGIGAAIVPSSYTPVEADILSWKKITYDNVGNQTSTTQVRDVALAEGFKQSWLYDANDLYATQVERCGDKNGDGVIEPTNDPCDTAALSHDSLGRLESGVNNRFEPVEFRYDELGRLKRGTDVLGYIRDYTFDDNGNADGQQLYMKKLGSSFSSRFIDDPQGTNESLTLVDSSSSRYDDSDRLRVSLDAGGNATYYSYDAMGNLETVTNPDNYTIAFEYDGLGRVVSAFDEEGREAKRAIDPIGRMRSLTDPNGNTETFVYYDETFDGRLEKQCEAPANSSATSRCTSFVYDANGNVTLLTDNAGSITQTTYDALNRPERIVAPVYTDPVHGQVRPVTRYSYDLLGNTTIVEAGYTDVLGLASSDVLQTQQTMIFDDWGRALTVTDALGESTTYTYNVSGDVLTETIPYITLTPEIGSDDLTPITIVREYEYGGLLSKSGDVSYRHNALGQLTEVSGRAITQNNDSHHSTYSNNYSYTYDSAHRLQSEASPGLSYTYTTSPGGLLEKVVVRRGNISDTINYRYDKTGRLHFIDYNDTEQVRYGFDDGGRLRNKYYPGGVSASYDYFDDNRLKQLLVSGASTLLQQDFTYDNLGRRDTLTENLNGTITNSSYGYDALSRLTSETLGSQTQSFTYDQFDNRITHTKFDGSTDFYEYDVAQQLKTIRDTNGAGIVKARYQYMPSGALYRSCEGDSAANVTSDATIRGECDLREYTFTRTNPYGQLDQIGFYNEPGTASITHEVFQASTDSTEFPNLTQTLHTYRYDYLGRRMEDSGRDLQGLERNDPDGDGTYVFNWTNGVQGDLNPFNTQYRYLGEAIYLSYNTGQSVFNPDVRWLQGAGIDEPLVRYGSDGSVTNYHQDGRNSAVLTTNAQTGAAIASQQFDAFGIESQSSGSIAQFGYTGREPAAQGLMYYRARYYNPSQGRFIQRDPRGFIDGINQYAYVVNNPVNGIDPYGTDFNSIASGPSVGTAIPPTIDQSSYPTGADPITIGSTPIFVTPTEPIKIDIPTNNGFSQATQFTTGLLTAGSSQLVRSLGPSAVNTVKNAASTLKQGAKELFGVGFPTKNNRGGRPQPFNPENGQFLPDAANPGPTNSVGGRFTSGFAQGFAEATSNQANLSTPVGFAGQLGHSLGTFTGTLVGVFK